MVTKCAVKLGVVPPPLIPALRRQGQVDVFKFEASLFYRASSRTDRATEKPSQKKKKYKNQTN